MKTDTIIKNNFLESVLEKLERKKAEKEESLDSLDAVTRLAAEIYVEQKDLDPEIQEMVDEHFWYLLTEGDS